MFHKLIPLFKLQMKICNIFSLTPFEWPNDQKFPIPLRSPWRSVIYKISLLVQWIYVTIMFVNLLATAKNKHNTIASKLLGIVFLDCFMVTLSLRTVIFRKEQDTLHMMSSFLRFERLNPEVLTQKQDPMSKVLMILGMFTSFGLPSLMLCILLVDPCKPPHLGYILYKTGKDCKIPNIVIRGSLLIFDYLMWTNSIAPACYYVFEYMFLGLHCMDHYTQVMTRKLNGRNQSIKKTAEASPESVPNSKLTTSENPNLFHTEKAANRESVFKSMTYRYHAQTFHVYRQIYILNRFYDNVLQAVFLPSIITAALSCVIISLYACLRLHRQIPMPGLAFFPLLASDGLSVIFIIKVAGGVLTQSEKFIATAKNNWKFSNKSLFKKVARSLGKVKVRFGSTNFVDQLTPFVFIDFCFTNTVNLMLIL